MGRPNAKELNFWTKDEYEQFIQCFSSDEEMYRIIFQMLFWLGCRVGELLALTSQDIDFENGMVNISKKYYRRNQTDYITPPKTGSSNRKITILKFLAEGMKSLVIAQRVGHDSVNTTMNIYGHLYPNKQKQVADLLNAEAAGELESNLVDMVIEMRFRKVGAWS